LPGSWLGGAATRHVGYAFVAKSGIIGLAMLFWLPAQFKNNKI